jgi:hypothetical protein
MSWSIGFDSKWNRDIGYGVPAFCDHPKCAEKIDRGLSHVCGGEPYGGEKGCGLYFCASHLIGYPYQRCKKCACYKQTTYRPKPEHPEWIDFKMTDPSWAVWRSENTTVGKPEVPNCSEQTSQDSARGNHE